MSTLLLTLALFLLLWCGLSLIAAAVWSLWVGAVKRGAAW